MPTLFHYFRPRDGNSYVLAWFGCMAVVELLAFYWIFLRGGAEMLVGHSRIFSCELSDPAKVKMHFLLCGVIGIVAAVLLFTTVDLQLPFMKVR